MHDAITKSGSKLLPENAYRKLKPGEVYEPIVPASDGRAEVTGWSIGLGLGLVAAQHLEGGPHAQLYVKVGAVEIEVVGRYGTSGGGIEASAIAWRPGPPAGRGCQQKASAGLQSCAGR